MTTKGVSCFVGSSNEGLAYTKALAEHLEAREIASVPWTNAFDLGKTTVEALDDALNRDSFAVLIATADDLTRSRGKAASSPRDNVILEYGLFAGRFGRDRTFLLVEETGKALKLPSDLLGVTLAPFPSRKTKKAKRKSMAEPAAKVAAQIEKLGPLETPSDPTVTNAIMDSASRLIDELRSMRRGTMSAVQQTAWATKVLRALHDTFLVRSEDAYVAWLRPDGNTLKIVQALNLLEEDWPKHAWKQNEGMAGKVWATAQPLAVDKRHPHPWFIPREGCENETYLCVPLAGPSAPEGLLAVGSDKGFEVQSVDLACLALYAQLIAFATPKQPQH